MRPRRSVMSRAAILRSIGYPSYQAYLDSGLWAKIRLRVLRRNPVCQMCEGEARCVHHRVYDRETMLGERESSLVPLCLSCHQKIEVRGNGTKRKTANANYYLNRVTNDMESGRAVVTTSPAGTINFGKYRGRQWSEAPSDWLIWCRTNIKATGVLGLVRQELAARASAVRQGTSPQRAGVDSAVSVATAQYDRARTAPWE